MRTIRQTNRQPRAWTTVEDKRLLAERARGLLLRELAVLLRRSEGSVRNRVSVLAGAYRNAPWTPEQVGILRAMRARGSTWAECGEHLGRSAKACYEQGARLAQGRGATGRLGRPLVAGRRGGPRQGPMAKGSALGALWDRAHAGIQLQIYGRTRVLRAWGEA